MSLALGIGVFLVFFPEPQPLQLTAFSLPYLAIVYLWGKGFEDAQLSWIVPLTGYTATFMIGAGLSASNRDIRTTVEIVGLGVFASVTMLGSYYALKSVRLAPQRQLGRRMIRHVVAGVICNLVLVSLVAYVAHGTYLAKTRPSPTEPDVIKQSFGHSRLTGPVPVWIDTDPACGVGQTADVDDCWALLAAVRSPEIEILGISTVFGNQDGTRVFAFAQELFPRLIGSSQMSEHPPQIFPGSVSKARSTWPPTPASHALAAALERVPFTILALGPLTNIATLIKNRPDLTANIQRIVLVGGKRPGQLFHPGHHWWFHFGDFNISHDPEAADIVLYAGVPITLVPFDLATKLLVTEADIERLRAGDDSAQWLSHVSQPWLSFWNSILGKPGFHPFDMLAVAYTATPEYFRCRSVSARIGFNLFLEPFGMGRDLEVAEELRGPVVTDCFDLDHEVKDVLLMRLMGPSNPAS